MQTPINLLVPALIFTAIGIVVGVVAALIIVDRTRTKGDQKPPAEESAAPDQPSPGLPADRFSNVTRLYRELSSSQLVVEVDDKIYLKPEFAPTKVRDDLEKVVEELADWLGKPSQPAVMPAPVEPPTPAFVSIPTEPVKASVPAEAPHTISIVSQINTILQELLAESALSERRISLTQEPSMGVVVWVDGTKFSGIESVPETEVREIIQAAVKKWERKNDLSRRYP